MALLCRRIVKPNSRGVPVWSVPNKFRPNSVLFQDSDEMNDLKRLGTIRMAVGKSSAAVLPNMHEDEDDSDTI